MPRAPDGLIRALYRERFGVHPVWPTGGWVGLGTLGDERQRGEYAQA